ncbi:MAG: hypothetical protein ACRC3J_05330 [Culicoidibacterales bacterium]
MNRVEATKILRSIDIERRIVAVNYKHKGFGFYDACTALGDFDRAMRVVAALLERGVIVNRGIPELGPKTDFYTFVK